MSKHKKVSITFLNIFHKVDFQRNYVNLQYVKVFLLAIPEGANLYPALCVILYVCERES